MLRFSLMLFAMVGLFPGLLVSAEENFSEKPVTTIEWYWEDHFTTSEKEMIRLWLNRVTGSVELVLGPYPFDLQFFIHRRDHAGEPVPWANTRRMSNEQGVDFHIDPSYPLNSFLEDWTAPHEISHLSIPYLGRENAWFAEGYASFMQYQVMEQMGIYTNSKVNEKYAAKLAIARPYYRGEDPVVTIAKSLQKSHRYRQMYWGSASYFMQLDDMIRAKHGTSLSGVIREYQNCCRQTDATIDEIVASWDRLLESSACGDLLRVYQNRPASEVFIWE